MAGKSSSRKKIRGLRAERVDYAVAVLPPAPPAEADAAFACWLAEHGGSVPERDIWVDDYYGEGGEVLRRYRVHSDAF